MSEQFNFAQRAAQDVRFLITVVAALVLGLLMLFIKEATPFMKNTLIPSLAIYTIGTGLIAGIHTVLVRRSETLFQIELEKVGKDLNKTEARPMLSPIGLSVIFGVHVIWFILFCAYNIYLHGASCPTP